MKRFAEIFNNLNITKKITVICSLLIIAIIMIIAFPTLARIQNRSTLLESAIWDGTIANSYRSGTGSKEDPYIIANGNELAYFYQQEQSVDYSDTYFKLSNDIVLNKGLFTYNESLGIRYTIDDITYYVDPSSNKYYLTKDFDSKESGQVNEFYSIDGFNGNFDGDGHRIYGLYLSDETNKVNELALFTTLRGELSNLYLENAMINGGTVSSPLVASSEFTTIENVLVSGNVVTRSENTTVTSTKKYVTTTVDNNKDVTLKLPNELPDYGIKVVSAKLTGNYQIMSDNPNTSVIIDGQIVATNDFSIDITAKDNITVAVNSSGYTQVVLNNLKYEIVYEYSISSGINAVNNATDITNAISRVNLYNAKVSGGIVGTLTGKATISKSYNDAEIKSDVLASGLIGIIENNDSEVRVYQSYNQGDLTSELEAGLIGYINNNTREVVINNSFNYIENQPAIHTIKDTTVEVYNTLVVNDTKAVETGEYDGHFLNIEKENLYDKTYLEEELLFQEFQSLDNLEDNEHNAWIFETDSLPILYLDDIKEAKAILFIKNNNWNNYSTEVNTIVYNEAITFKIEDSDEYVSNKSKQYYISADIEVLTKNELNKIKDWTNYQDLVTLEGNENYIIYVKIIDQNNKVSYINSDIIDFNIEYPPVVMKHNGNTYRQLTDEIENIYISSNNYLTIEQISSDVTIQSISYYLSDQLLNKETLKNLSNDTWQAYENNISIYKEGTYIAYVKIIDSNGIDTYLNSDRIIYDGYQQTLYLGDGLAEEITSNVAISSRSSITVNFKYTSAINDISNQTHNLTTNMLLPKNTKITMIDEITNEVYQYVVPTYQDLYDFENSCLTNSSDCQRQAHYPLTLFAKIGLEGTVGNYQEQSYYQDNLVQEDFTFIIEFEDTNIERAYENIEFKLELIDKNSSKVINTLNRTVKSVDVYPNKDASIIITPQETINSIYLNSNGSTNLNLNTSIKYNYSDTSIVLDSHAQNKYLGLSVRVVDKNNNIISSEYLRNIEIGYNEHTISFDDDNIARINLNTNLATSGIFRITTNNHSSNLPDGEYYLKINGYLAADGYHYNELDPSGLVIPLIVNQPTLNNETLNVEHSLVNSTIYKASDKAKIDLVINYSDNQDNRVVVSLYKKSSLSAYNQEYELLDLANYTHEKLNSHSEDNYYLNSKETSLNILTNQLEHTSYKLVFDLYNNGQKVSTVEKYFIVR